MRHISWRISIPKQGNSLKYSPDGFFRQKRKGSFYFQEGSVEFEGSDLSESTSNLHSFPVSVLTLIDDTKQGYKCNMLCNSGIYILRLWVQFFKNICHIFSYKNRRNFWKLFCFLILPWAENLKSWAFQFLFVERSSASEAATLPHSPCGHRL